MYSGSSQRLILDANIGIWIVLYPLIGQDVRARFTRWVQDGQRMAAPSLWLAEVTSAIRSAVHQRQISSARGQRALDQALALRVELVPIDPDLTRAAYVWSERLGQRRAYDGFYLALADREGAELWTADERLANSAWAAGIGWVRWVGEPL